MLIIDGNAALSEFRRAKLLDSLNTIAAVQAIEARYVHFVDTAQKLDDHGMHKLKSLLDDGAEPAKGIDGALFVVIPRPGTISPWSSKATDIIHNAGLKGVRRVERGTAFYISGDEPLDREAVARLLHDRMVESVVSDLESAQVLFGTERPRPLVTIDIKTSGKLALEQANDAMGLALSGDEVDYLHQAFLDLDRNPTDVELMMFGVVNSEHCRHKIFNADWVVDDQPQPKSLFGMIRNTYEKGGQDVLSAYSDNAAVLKGVKAGRFFADSKDRTFRYHHEAVHTVIKVETHNHPTAIAPAPGAATGSGGEIRDESATGRGGKSKMGLAGFSVSNLRIPELIQPWEQTYGKPGRVAAALDIMLEAPIGGAGFVNEFGRPNLSGYFRTYEQIVNDQVRGYHKPIMVAGGLGNIRGEHVQKQKLPVGSQIIVLGGPAMLIGLGGGAASSMQTGTSHEDLDFASVQRGNGEMERRAQEVIDGCWAQGKANPILSIHDVGAGGLSNALPELVHDCGRGARFEIRNIPNAEPGLSPMEIWCNEAQERYVLAVSPADLDRFSALCERERCPFAVVGEVTKEENLVVNDHLFDNQPVDIPLSVIFGKPPKMTRQYASQTVATPDFDTSELEIEESIKRVLQLPSVGSKKFLITIGDRTVGGLVVRDQMIGPWQVPVADAAITAVSFDSPAGEVMTMGERAPLAVIDAAASARIAIGEAITNALSADITNLKDIKLSANWMAAAGSGNEDQALFEAVKTVGEEFCPALGLTIPVGKDSLSMRTVWHEDDQDKSVTSPLSVLISAFAPVAEIAKSVTPQLSSEPTTILLLLDLGLGKNRLGGSALAQVNNQSGATVPDISPELLSGFFDVITKLKADRRILAYHDRSDGGLLTTALEMAFASRCGLELNLEHLNGTSIDKLFNEELGAIIQIRAQDYAAILKLCKKKLGENSCAIIGRPTTEQTMTIQDVAASGADSQVIYTAERAELEDWWSQTSYHMQKLRDNPETAQEEHDLISDNADPGLAPEHHIELKQWTFKTRPKVAIFREEGVNGQIEMAAAFDRAGFTAIDVHLHDIQDNSELLKDFVGLAVCGGFSYGDVLGAGQGWAKSILGHDTLKQAFQEFFNRSDTFSLGVCNGCQMLSALKSMIPGAEAWPTFLKNRSEQFEGRVVLTQITESPSIFFKDMAGSYLPIAVAHGEGRAQFSSDAQARDAISKNLVALQYVNNYHQVTEKYPANPNGSPLGITALTTPDGRATILMPHPERSVQSRQLSWHPADWPDDSPWIKFFQNARAWVELQN